MTTMTREVLVGLGIIATLLLFSAVGYGLRTVSDQGKNNHAFAGCIAVWASAENAVLNSRADANRGRTERLDRLLRVVNSDLTHPAKTPRAQRRQARQFKRNLRLYVIASDAFKAAVRSNPLPHAPEVACG